jgi:hypothetical protein
MNIMINKGRKRDGRKRKRETKMKNKKKTE